MTDVNCADARRGSSARMTSRAAYSGRKSPPHYIQRVSSTISPSTFFVNLGLLNKARQGCPGRPAAWAALLRQSNCLARSVVAPLGIPAWTRKAVFETELCASYKGARVENRTILYASVDFPPPIMASWTPRLPLLTTLLQTLRQATGTNAARLSTITQVRPHRLSLANS